MSAPAIRKLPGGVVFLVLLVCGLITVTLVARARDAGTRAATLPVDRVRTTVVMSSVAVTSVPSVGSTDSSLRSSSGAVATNGSGVDGSGSVKSSGPPTETPSRATGGAPTGGGSNAIAVFSKIGTEAQSGPTGYGAARFGDWLDQDYDGCDTRNDVLIRDLSDVAATSGSCAVTNGTLDDPYTGARIQYTGPGAASTVTVDHVVSLEDAWGSGANQWTDRERLRFANDPLNLLAVSAAAENDKADRSADNWLPANTAYDCAYVARQIAVKAKYHLGMTSFEKGAIVGVLFSCSKQTLPRDSA